MQKVHEFTCAEIAYGACQCDEEIKNGDLLVIDAPHYGEFNKQVIGLAWAWPLAVTVEADGLHKPKEDMGRDGLRELLADAKIEPAMLQAAVDLANLKGWPVDPVWQPLIEGA